MLSSTDGVERKDILPEPGSSKDGCFDVQELTLLSKELNSQEFYFKKLKESFIEKFQAEDSSKENNNATSLQVGHGQVYPDDADHRTQVLDIRRLLLAHPQNTCAEKNFHKELFSKLKFNYLEQAAKESFLTRILQISPEFVSAQALQDLERNVKESKETLKVQKTNFEAQKSEIYELIESTCTAHEQVTLQQKQAVELAEQIVASEAAYQKESFIDSPRLAEITQLEKNTLSHQEMLANLRRQVDDQQKILSDQQAKRALLDKDVVRLEAHKQEAHENALEAMRISKSKDPQVEELGKWYQEAISLLYRCSGVGDIRVISDSNMEITYNMDKETIYTVMIRILLDSEEEDLTHQQQHRQHRVEAQVIDANIPIGDILSAAAGFPKLDYALSFTVRAVYTRLQNMHRRNKEILLLQASNSDVMYDAHIGEIMVHNSQSGRMFVFQLDLSYPTSEWQGIRVMGVEPTQVAGEVEIWQDKIATLKPKSFTELVPCLE
ncbi:hypothetical protein BASA50_003217 [Batrachochytrium salamandrivorans]|uniref:Kinetochore protein Sos7 coiled-coil domain-containing protein n=1 Tax=Batrachochytrium salamandrivorans TaxID=1357716 RepID=A0ABQ8FJK3_9FUNG|nr:hypothetical protein BASA50_003217 [Batrachochytrium salamandrivorans]KAH6601835.1 hypothetical protein BASA61_001728 [Batrachochytrium salamandrivorans]KAH9269179.1 hypothetical protein BASA83_008801 [Batrachochytrium salamandrivorans]